MGSECSKAVVGNLSTTAGQKIIVIFCHNHNSSKGIHNIYHVYQYYFFPLGAWRATQELLAGPSLPTPALRCLSLGNFTTYGQIGEVLEPNSLLRVKLAIKISKEKHTAKLQSICIGL